jgi:hypothetical protein
MKPIVRMLCHLALFGMVGTAWGEIYKCVGPEGHVTYTNNKSAAANCKQISSDLPVSTLPSPRVPQHRQPTADFPRVDEETQKSRDGDRRRILEQELAAEREQLQVARKALVEGEATRLGGERNYQKYQERVQRLRDDVALHERNVDALQKELSNLK